VDDTKAFFEVLNLDHSGLEAVRDAVQSEDYARAKDLLVQYYKTRKHPGWYWDKPPDSGLYPALDTTTADDVLARRFTISHKTGQLEKKIDWSACPYGDREWTWLLNRHTYFLPLGAKYARTGDEKYAEAFNEIITDWILSNPVPSERAALGHSWRTLEAGIRMFNTWQMAWHAFKDSPSFTSDARILMLRSFAEHAEYLMKFPRGGNWELMQSNGLLHVGALFPEFKNSRTWRDTAVQRLTNQMRIQVYPDGAQFELTTSYHSISLWNLLQPVILKRIAGGLDFPKDYYESLKRMMLYDAAVVRPDGMLPMLNDADLNNTLDRVRGPAISLGGDRVPEIKDVLEVKPEKKSVFLPYAGIFAMRTGNRPEDLYLMMDAGPFGAGHQHEDKLNVEVYAYGRPFIVDPGRYSYTSAGGPFRGPGAHNLILVDGMGQSRRSTDRSKWIVSEPAPGTRWVSTDEFDYAEGTYDEGFGPENDTSVTHIRKVFFVKPEYWIVIDVLSGEGKHKFEQLWHFMPGAVDTGSGFVRTVNLRDANLAIIRPDNPDIRIVEGEEMPILGYFAPHYNERHPAPTVVFTRACEAPTAFETVLYPSPGDKQITPEVRPIRCLVDGKRPKPGQVSAISIRFSDFEDIFVLCHDPEAIGKTKRFLHFEFTGEGAWIRLDSKGKVVRSLMLNSACITQANGV
jgi:hypothetical protein